jgi:hypothetical protein
VYRGYLEERCTPEAVQKRADVIVENIGKRHRGERGVGRYKWEIERDRAAALAWLSDPFAAQDCHSSEDFHGFCSAESCGKLSFSQMFSIRFSLSLTLEGGLPHT